MQRQYFRFGSRDSSECPLTRAYVTIYRKAYRVGKRGLILKLIKRYRRRAVDAAALAEATYLEKTPDGILGAADWLIWPPAQAAAREVFYEECDKGASSEKMTLAHLCLNGLESVFGSNYPDLTRMRWALEVEIEERWREDVD